MNSLASSRWAVYIAIFVTTAIPEALGQSEYEIVDNSPFELNRDSIRAPLVGVRPLTAAGFGESLGQPVYIPRFRITKKLIADAAAQFEEVRAELARRGLGASEIELADWSEIIDASGYKERYLFDTVKVSAGFHMLTSGSVTIPREGKIIMSDYATEPAYKIWDAVTLTNMVATGVINTRDVEIFNLDGSDVETVQFDPRLAKKLESIYKRKPWLEEQSPYEVGLYMAALQMEIREYNALEQSLLSWVGDITFGSPIVYTAEEKRLELPESIRRSFDVYWIELRTSFRIPEDEDIYELVVNYAFPADGVALELIPLQYGPEVAVEERRAIPGFDLEIEGIRASVDEAFSRMVAFKYVKPTVVAVGLGEPEFSWLLRGEAVRIGSHKFVVIAGVPKGTATMNLGMSGHIRLRKGVLGSLFGGAELAGTDVRVMPISF